MCGIAGSYLWRGAVERSRLDAAAAALSHRGPDGRGFYLHGPVGLAHTRLAIIDLAQGNQPLYSADGNLCLIANGEIYNYLELRAALAARAHRFATHSDCEPALYAYREQGDRFLNELEGMFALALYDREREELVLARDRLGIKPLFLRFGADGVHFASEVKALYRLTGERPEVDAAGLAQYLQNGFSSRRLTPVRGIERLLPGEAIRVGRQGVLRRWRYWTPAAAKPETLGFHEAAHRFDALMDQVMVHHMRADVPFGLFLSGGVDSACLLALMRRHAGGTLRTYSVGFPGSGVHSELDAAAAIARRFETDHTVLELDARTLLHSLPHAVWAADELMADYANLPVSLMAQRAGRDLKVVLSGEGGDEVFAGYARYRQPAPKRWWKNLLFPGSGGFRASKTFKARWERALYGPALRESAAAWRTPFVETWEETPARWPVLARQQAVDLATWLPDDLLVKADRMLMVWGVEGRVPYLDHRVVEFGLGLPDTLKVEGRTGKLFLRRWAERHLPPAHLQGPKRGFTVPVRDWLAGEHLDRLERALARHAGIRAWFEPRGLAELCARHRRRGDQATSLWRLWQFAIWHSLFVRGDGAAPAAQTDPFALIEAGR